MNILTRRIREKNFMSNTMKENKMGTMPVNKLLINMALPMMISMLVQALYNICLLYTSPSPRDAH